MPLGAEHNRGANHTQNPVRGGGGTGEAMRVEGGSHDPYMPSIVTGVFSTIFLAAIRLG
jgi:hypothetical protein